MITSENVDDVFSYHAPTSDQQAQIDDVRDAAKVFAHAILARVPTCADQQAALRKVREALMTANAAIVLEGRG